MRWRQPAAQKIKKGSASENPYGSLTLHLVPNPDILKELAKLPAMRSLVRVGFAAETERSSPRTPPGKLAAKDLDILVANDVAREDIGFQAPNNEVTLYYRDGNVEPLPSPVEARCRRRHLGSCGAAYASRRHPLYDLSIVPMCDTHGVLHD